MTPQLVLVEWEDASVVDSGTWVHREDAPPAQPEVFQQVGWMLELTDAHVVITASLSHKLMSARDRIPRGMVRSIHVFDVADGKPMPPNKRRKRT